MQAVIMAGGEGRRLRPLTDLCPKPLVPVHGRPVIAWILAGLRRHGIEEVVVTLGYRGRDIRGAIGDGRPWGVRVRYVEETRPLGTAGGVRQALDGLRDTFAVLSGDLLAEVDLPGLAARHRADGNVASICLVRPSGVFPFGLAEHTGSGRLVRFVEKPRLAEVFPRCGVNTGVYVLEPEALARVPAGDPCDFSHQLFPALLEAGLPVGVYFHATYWRDIGTVDSYLEAHWDLLSGRFAPERFAGCQDLSPHVPGASVRPPVLLGPRCRVGPGAVLAGPVVAGADCIIATRAELQRCVLWDGCVVGAGARLDDCVVASGGCVPAGARLQGAVVVGEPPAGRLAN